MAWWVRVDDLVLPKQLAGHPALELINTRAGWGEPYRENQEYLASIDHLVVLGRINGLLDDARAQRLRRQAARDPAHGDRVVKRARQLRGDLHDVLVGTGSRAAAGRLAAAVTHARSQQQLEVEPDGARWRFPGPPSPSEPLDAFLVSAGHLLVERPTIGACPGHDCGWLFLNPSGRRRWCQMAVCGNRAKQAAHLARARQ